MSNFDLIIGSDLIYFPESIDPLCMMLKKLFSKNKNLVFYMCHMKRDVKLHEEWIRALFRHNLLIELIDHDSV